MNNNLYKTLPYCDCWNSEINLMMSFIWKSNTRYLLKKCFPYSCNIDNCIAKWRLLSDTSRSFHYWLVASRWRQLPLLASLANPPKGSHVNGKTGTHYTEKQWNKREERVWWTTCIRSASMLKKMWNLLGKLAIQINSPDLLWPLFTYMYKWGVTFNRLV